MAVSTPGVSYLYLRANVTNRTQRDCSRRRHPVVESTVKSPFSSSRNPPCVRMRSDRTRFASNTCPTSGKPAEKPTRPWPATCEYVGQGQTGDSGGKDGDLPATT